MIPYQFKDGTTIDLENLVAVEPIQFINCSINKHSDYMSGENYYNLVFKFSTVKLTKYGNWEIPYEINKAGLEIERDQLIEDWKSGRSRCLVENSSNQSEKPNI